MRDDAMPAEGAPTPLRELQAAVVDQAAVVVRLAATSDFDALGAALRVLAWLLAQTPARR